MISNPKKKILYVSKCWVGKSHDFNMLKQEFPPDQDWFEDHIIELDLGFQGFQNLYKCKTLRIPKKKPRGKELSENDKQNNRDFSSTRIKVEHSIGGLKRFRILSDRLRVKDFDFYDDVLGICAGLWNFINV